MRFVVRNNYGSDGYDGANLLTKTGSNTDELSLNCSYWLPQTCSCGSIFPDSSSLLPGTYLSWNHTCWGSCSHMHLPTDSVVDPWLHLLPFFSQMVQKNWPALSNRHLKKPGRRNRAVLWFSTALISLWNLLNHHPVHNWDIGVLMPLYLVYKIKTYVAVLFWGAQSPTHPKLQSNRKVWPFLKRKPFHS